MIKLTHLLWWWMTNWMYHLWISAVYKTSRHSCLLLAAIWTVRRTLSPWSLDRYHPPVRQSGRLSHSILSHPMCAIKTRSWEEGMSRYTVYHVCTGTWYMIFPILVMTISKSLERTCCDDHFLNLVPRPFLKQKKGLQGSICIIIITQDTLACTYLLLSFCSSTIVARGANYMQIALVRMRVRKI